MLAAFAQSPSWIELLNQLLPVLLVVIVGVLTIVKRVIERYVLKRHAAPADDDAGEDATDTETADEAQTPSMMDEIKRYIDVIEGRPTSGPPTEDAPPQPTPTAPVADAASPAPPPPPPRPTREPRPARIRRRRLAAPLVDQPLDLTVSHRDLSFDATALRQAIEFTHSELLEGSAVIGRRRRGLPPVGVRRSPRAIREAMLWREILATPPGLLPPPGLEDRPGSSRPFPA